MKPIPGFPHYKATEDGRIWSEYKQGYLSQTLCKHTGYKQVTLCEDNKRHQMHVHRLVALAFLPYDKSKPWINHKDECRTNNHVSNLEWCTPQYNNTYGDCKKKMVETVGIENLRKSANYARSFRLRKVRCIETGEVFQSTNEAARQMGLAGHSGIVGACRGTYKTSAGYHWEYVEEAI